MVSQHLANFDGHRHCGSGDMFLICHVTHCDHCLKGCNDFTSGSPSYKVTTMPSLLAIGLAVEEI